MNASRLGPAMLPGIGRLGAGVCTIVSQQRQDFLGRTISVTVSLAAIMSSISLTSSLIVRSGPPHAGQSSPGSNRTRWRGVASDTRGLRRGFFGPLTPQQAHQRPALSSTGASVVSAVGDLNPFEDKLELFDLTLDLLGARAMLLPTQPQDPDPKTLDQQIAGA